MSLPNHKPKYLYLELNGLNSYAEKAIEIPHALAQREANRIKTFYPLHHRIEQ
jgi:hypothetical protein